MAPRLANFLTHAPGLRGIAKVAAGVAPEREVPRFANHSFQRLIKKRNKAKSSGSPVMLWPDTFNNYFHPETAMAAVDVLEAAGFTVRFPKENVCCGRPLYDFGMLDRAKRLLLRTLSTLEGEIAEDIPVVVLEPSCASVFRDEMLNLFPDDVRAQKLARQVVLLSEFLRDHADGFELPMLKRKALVHGHCHHKSIMKMTAEESTLRKMGIDYQAPAPDAAGWRALLVSKKKNMRPQLPLANWSFCRRCVIRLRTGSSSPMASVAANKFSNAPEELLYTWRK